MTSLGNKMVEKAETQSSVVALKRDRSRRQDSLYARSFREFLRHRVALVALAIVVVIVAASILAPHLTNYDPVGRNARDRMLEPSLAYPLGTDALGRDVLTRILYGGQISLQVGFLSIVLAAIIGVPLGLFAGYFGGRVDNIIMRIMDLILAFPGLILIIWLFGLLG